MRQDQEETFATIMIVAGGVEVKWPRRCEDRRDDLPSSLSRLRGVAILGILVVNVELFRGPDYLLNLPYATAGLASSYAARRTDRTLRCLPFAYKASRC